MRSQRPSVRRQEQRLKSGPNRLTEDALRDPAAGVGKPEALRHVLQGAWSRRITEEHRLVHLVDGDDLVVLQARYHHG
jgi:toxin YoeB